MSRPIQHLYEKAAEVIQTLFNEMKPGREARREESRCTRPGGGGGTHDII